MTQPRKPLYVVTCVSNPVRYASRYDLYRKFKKQVEDAGAILYTVEMAFGDRPFEVTERDCPRHVQVRSHYELWHKENMLNLGIQALPDDWEYVAWIDADVMFSNPNWVSETVEQLQHYMFVQMFSHATDLDPRGAPMKTHTGFVHDWYHDTSKFNPGGGYQEGHPGYAWAARREALDAVGGLIDWAILGSADRHMACAMIGRGDASFDADVSKHYKHGVRDWEARCTRRIKRDIGYMSGTILHAWHGSKANRHYNSRWKILVEHKFNPWDDIFRDTQGLYQLEDDTDKIGLRDAVRKYFRSRHEDSIETGNDKILP